MAYTPPSPKFESGPAGRGIFSKPAGDEVKVKIFDKEGDAVAYSLKLSEQDTDVKKHIRPGSWNVRLSGDKKKIYSISPWEGQFKVKFVEFAHKKDEEPKPNHQPAKPPYGNEYDYMTAIMEIVDGECAGMKFSLRLRYNFKAVIEEIDGKEVEVVGYNKSVAPNSKSEPTKLLNRWMIATGTWERGPIRWRDNLLPVIAKRAHEQDKTFGLLIEDGWVKSILVNSPEVVEETFEE